MVTGHIVTRAARQNPQFRRLRSTFQRRLCCRVCDALRGAAVLLPLFH